jgi:hypothetical protein
MITPHKARVRVSRGEALGDVMKTLRTWLDGQKIEPTEFKTIVDARGFTLDFGFASAIDADRFRNQFQPAG